MTFTALTNDIATQAGTKLYDFKASGTIYKGQAVCLCPGMDDTVYVPTDITASAQRVIGIADYTVADKEKVAIWGPYNIVRCRLSGQAGAVVAAGDNVGMGFDGMLTPFTKYSGAIVVEASTASTTEGVVLLTGYSCW